MINLMHDLETLSLKPNAVILAIGAVLFDNRGVHAEFYQPVTLTSQKGRDMDANTILWWMKQSEEARTVFSDKSAGSLSASLRVYNEWLRDNRFMDGGVWGNGSDFDNVVMVDAYNYCEATPPWKFYQHRCFRTMKSQFPIEFERVGIHHHAMHDAKHQANHLIEIANRIGMTL